MNAPYNVVFISVDTMRADHLGCYGYSRPTSPRMDALAADGVLFSQAIAPHVPTAPSHTTFYTGLDVFGHTIAAHLPKHKLSPKRLMLPQILQRHGYSTAAVDNMVTLGRGLGSWFARGYDYYSGFRYEPSRLSGGKPQAATLTKRALELLKLMRRDPFFLFVHYWDPHTPYRPPPTHDSMFYEGDPRDPRHTSLDVLEDLAGSYYSAVLADMNMTGVTDIEYPIAQYDAEIRVVDDQIAEILNALQRYGLTDRTLIVLVSDHGEALGEGGLYFEHHGLYDAVVRIAAIMSLPDALPSGRRVDAMVAGYDLAPTILDLLGVETGQDISYPLTGASLVPLMSGEAGDGHSSILLTEATRQGSYGLRTKEWKLILPVTQDAQGRPLPDFYGNPRSPEPLLYHLPTDPHERHNVAEQHTDIARALTKELGERVQSGLAQWGGVDPVASQTSGQGFAQAMDKLSERTARRRPVEMS
jgi:arylsulfatase A-like enzyme